MAASNYNSDKALYKRLLLRCIIAIFCVIFIFFIIPKAIRLLLPLVIAFIVAAIVNPLVNKLHQKLGISRKVTAIILDLLIFIIVFSLIGILLYSIVIEAISLVNYILANRSIIMDELNDIKNSFTWLISLLPPQVIDLLADFEENLVKSIQAFSKNMLNHLLYATNLITTMAGNFFVNFIIAILAAYFIIADYNQISLMAKKYLGRKNNEFFSIIKNSIFSALGGYLKSQILLALFAFIFMFIALIIIRQPYALLIAFCLGIVDLLPIVGTIAVVLPWGIFAIAGGEINKGIYLVVIGIAFFLIRKIIEPKIVGSQTGLHPLAALASTYVGLQFSGIWGAVLGPLVLMLTLSIVRSGIFDSTVADLKKIKNKISTILNSK